MKQRLRRWGIPLGVIVLLILGGMLILQHWTTSESDGTVHVGDPSTPASQVTPMPVPVKTSYFTTVLPAGFSIKRNEEHPSNPQILANVLAYGGTNNAISVGITIGSLPSGGLSEVGDYNLRVHQTNTYTRTSSAGMPAGATAFRVSSGQPGLTIFEQHGTHYAEIAVGTDSGAPYEQIETIYRQLQSAWQWL